MHQQINQKAQELLNKKMDRRDFLRHVGIGALLLFGLGSIIKTLTTAERNVAEKKTTTGYGSGAYGA